eukprot:TRINITY_DN20471_c0_g1_i1.p1 TRINITY_DN20471_c0_g1~~TRINITY_DN20471_c0_g1_i1.p1  ORF type:complete len:437 (+),score=68.51 TRINITY_DN20471_c0_g1_i1:76-1386(+)
MPVSSAAALPILEGHGKLPGAVSRLQYCKPAAPLASSVLESGRRTSLYDTGHDAALLGVPGLRFRRRARDFHSFLSSEASSTAGSFHSQHQDFLFGGSTSSYPAKKAHDLASLEGWKLPTPKQSMMEAFQALPAVAASFAGPVWKQVQPVVSRFIDPFSDGKPQEEEEETGWCKTIPRVLRVVYWTDLVSLLMLAHSTYYVCDTPLRTWLLGGFAMGFPLTDLVDRVVVANDVRFKVVRLQVKKLRSGGNPENFKLDSVSLYNRLGVPIHRSLVSERQEVNYWFVEITDGPELVTGYKLITHRTEGPGTDPVSWIAEGSYDGVNWQVIDECDGENMPTQREAASQYYDDLDHLPDAQAAFRKGFLVEMAATAGAFAWLALGTSWVSSGTEACIDSAPYLWYYCYFLVVLIWSGLGTVTIGLIVGAVAMILLPSKPS